MAETPPSPSLQSQGKKPGESKAEEAHEEGGRITSNGGQASSSSMPFAGEMERRGEEKLLDERIRERYQKEIGDIFDD